MITRSINFSEFCNSFSEQYNNYFSYEGKRALYDYLEDYSEDEGKDVDLDIIALCCDYTEYENLEEYNHNYCLEGDDRALNLKDIEEETQVIRIYDSAGKEMDNFIIANY